MLKQLQWRLLITPLAVLAATVAIAAAWVHYTDLERIRTHAALEGEQRTLAAVRERVSQSDHEKEVILRYLSSYESLRSHGFVGPEQRVSWLDALRRASSAVRIFGVDYQLGQQTPSLVPVDAPAYQLQQSVMKLQLRLLHEEDLLRFLEALDAERAGIFLLRKCVLARAGSADFAARFEPRLSAECELVWLSLTPREQAVQP